MKLSEAIRLGSMLRPQGFGEMYPEKLRFLPFPRLRKLSCAWGAAWEANGFHDSEEWDELFRVVLECPACPSEDAKYRFSSISGLIIHLNDHHRWTREAIANHIQTIEESIAIREAENKERRKDCELIFGGLT